MVLYQHLVNVGECRRGKDVKYCQDVLIPTHHHRPTLAVVLDSLYEDVHQNFSVIRYVRFYFNPKLLISVSYQHVMISYM
jgi:hypothetical protein